MSRRPRSSFPTRRGRRAALASATGLACAAALAVVPAAAADDAGSGDRPAGRNVLKGSVGPGFDISINKESVPAGRYKLVVKDLGTIHNFHITGTRVDKATSVPGTGKEVFKVRLRPGTYEIVCDPHSSTMKTTLTVT